MKRATYEELAEWSIAALTNARRLFSDAEALLEADRPASAMVLLGLAADEIGKHVMVSALPARADTDAEWKKFWKRVGNHVDKLGNPLLMDWMLDWSDIEGPPNPAEFHELRKTATYADLTPRGVTIPSEIVTLEMVEPRMKTIGRFLQYCETVTRRTDVRRLAATMRRMAGTQANESGHSSNWRRAHALAVVIGAPTQEAERFADLVENVLDRETDGGNHQAN
jgi:AbiV family abortive infection protein